MSQGERRLVGKGEVHSFYLLGFDNFAHLPVERKEGLPQRRSLHFHVGPSDAVLEPPSDCLEKSFFGRKPEGKTGRGSGSLLTPLDFSLGKDPVQEEFSPACDDPLHPLDLDHVNAGADNHLLLLQIVDCRLWI
jgi:hypothetical protein